MSDLISRQAAIDELTVRRALFCDNTPRSFSRLSYAEKCRVDEIDSAIATLVNLPSVQPEQKTGKWIPCSERLPEDNVPVNITWVNHKPEEYYAAIKDKPFTATGVYFKGKWYWYSSTIEDCLAEYGRAEWDEIEEATADCIEIIAWMYLPEPYKEGQE